MVTVIDKAALGAWLKDARRDAGYSQIDFARATGVAQSLVSRHEAGEVVFSPVHARAYARVLGKSEDELLTRAGHRTGEIPPETEPSLTVLLERAARQARELEDWYRQARTLDGSRSASGFDMMAVEAIAADDVASGQAYDVETAADIEGTVIQPDGRRGFEALFVPKSRLRHPDSHVVGLRFRGMEVGPGLHYGVSILVERTDDYRIGDRVLARYEGRFYCRTAQRQDGVGVVLIPTLPGDTQPPLRASETEIVGLVPAVLLWS